MSLTAGSGRKIEWACDLGHLYVAGVVKRCGVGRGCPYCSGRRVIVGVTDFATTHPDIARQAVDQDLPEILSAGSKKKIEWLCHFGHKLTASVCHRCLAGSGCPLCLGRFDHPFGSTHAQIAKQAIDQSLPLALTAGSSKRVAWRCESGHEWSAAVKDRCRNGNGCPDCATRGYKNSLPGCVYILETATHGVFGITNDPKKRLKTYCTSRRLVGLYQFDDGEAARCAETCIKQSFGVRGLSLEPGEVTESFDLSSIDLVVAAIIEHGGQLAETSNH